MITKISANLKSVGGTTKQELLVFKFEEPICIDLTNDDPEQLKQFFSKLLIEFYNSPFSIEFDNEEKRGDLFADISQKYIQDLNTELKALISLIPEKPE